MHELSIVSSVVESVADALKNYPGARVIEVRLRVGSLAAVVEDSLQFCWQIATEGTRQEDAPLAGSRLVVKLVPVTVHCTACGEDGAIESLQHFRCPTCGGPAADVRHGRELEIEAIEIEDAAEEAKSNAPEEAQA
jgi:hydrogenase nickel incorporation protein HypA/HybF